MKSIVFAALMGYATATAGDFGNNATDQKTAPVATTGAITVNPVSTGDIEAPEAVEEDKALYETEEKIHTTDFKDNAAFIEEKEDFSWDGFSMADFTFGDVLDMMNNDENVGEMKNSLKVSFMRQFKAQEDKLPEVCESGKSCRDKIREETRIEVAQEWKRIMTDIRILIETTVKESKDILTTTYKDAFNCDPGCKCEFIDNRYAYLLTTVEEITESIEWYQSEIDVRGDYITELDINCPKFDDEYQPIW
jgi:hypothetical protein